MTVGIYDDSMDWEYEGEPFEVVYTIDQGFPGSWSDGVQPDLASLVHVEFVPGADLSAAEAAALVARMNALFESDEAFRLALEKECLEHAQGVEERRTEERLSD